MFERKELKTLLDRLAEPRKHIQVLLGPRQVGKTTLVRQAIPKLGTPVFFHNADDMVGADATWLRQIWEAARLSMKAQTLREAVLVVDEVQKIPLWNETVKSEWDRDTFSGLQLKVVLLGSSRLMMEKGLGDSLTGRFELLPLLHWDFSEMRAAFGLSVEQFIWFGGYPGAASLIPDEPRWKNYLLDAIIEPTLARDIFQLARIEKPVLMRRLLELGCHYSGQILSYTKMLGQLQDAGNTATLVNYLSFLNAAGLLAGIENYHKQETRVKASQPKWQVYNNALLSARARESFEQARFQPEKWGHWVESAVGAHLVQAAARRETALYYWRENNLEADFILEKNGKLLALEVKSTGAPAGKGLSAFEAAFRPEKVLLVGERGLPVEEFLQIPVGQLF